MIDKNYMEIFLNIYLQVGFSSVFTVKCLKKHMKMFLSGCYKVEFSTVFFQCIKVTAILYGLY